ncbi:Ribokinase-like protein [Bimuria novae-zelandiae CBS 107.79]|uniref:Ribokinase-like protein n=1 Tax=Bimuria novae-zelandiae CBS 107.79 TaxID=1447943 RepID=A0A6A5V4R2_9PLEO|nr:Ribokinase-like protein [Bimuria novae-zelandiae CBS 107.79]
MSPKSFEIFCVSLGMVIIDDIYMANREQPLKNVLGGSATFVTLGQRLFTKSSQIGCLVVAGSDFPSSVRTQIEDWGVQTVVRRRAEPSTRGKLVYKDDTFGPKTFEYVHPPLRASPTDLIGTSLLHAKAFHLFGTPQEVLAQAPELLRLHGDGYARPLIVWEPLPPACIPENYETFVHACKLVDIFSPNHLELDALFGSNIGDTFDVTHLEQCARTLVDEGIGPEGSGSLIVRAGENGALITSKSIPPTWFPPYYDIDSLKVVDPTGAGNTFLGGYIAGLHATDGDPKQAMHYGTVAASFALEQIGLSEVTQADGRVFCNGVAVLERLEECKTRIVYAKHSK